MDNNHQPYPPTSPVVYIVSAERGVKRLYEAISAEETVVEDFKRLIAMAVNAASLSVNDVENNRHNAINDYLYPLQLTVRERENYIAHLDVFIQDLITGFHQLGIRDLGGVEFVGFDGMDIVVNVYAQQ
ncbi:MAG: hypothetical protein CMF37_15490 [Leeuwenhoekiella sp.]|nr:hypothetical protein [Leeuwenhoekiella sp.]MBH14316.1 hypothetical protein [Leeuwenhoekiella sp.]MBQ50177.1 hypothetical protein [Leeuwenhoekiella sp.]MBQ50374.1 hypothetical protein [Leeuwenhoekiella sp.]MBQ50571.1 hypothetical protein [Leeuwenhoekiella sp.]|tara:strand:+ start:8573 stop:8959 length:387 start_codon:yes stop_codon:yes gene_type:complete